MRRRRPCWLHQFRHQQTEAHGVSPAAGGPTATSQPTAAAPSKSGGDCVSAFGRPLVNSPLPYELLCHMVLHMWKRWVVPALVAVASGAGAGCSNDTVIDRPSPVIDTEAPRTLPPATVPASTESLPATPVLSSELAPPATTGLATPEVPSASTTPGSETSAAPAVKPGELAPGTTLPPLPPLTFPPGYLDTVPGVPYVEYSLATAQDALDTVTAKLTVAIEGYVDAKTREDEVAALKSAFFEPRRFASGFEVKGVRSRLQRPIPVTRWKASRVIAGGDNCIEVVALIDGLMWIGARGDPAELIVTLARNDQGWTFSSFTGMNSGGEEGAACQLVSSESF
jgi:hypothetical protein